MNIKFIPTFHKNCEPTKSFRISSLFVLLAFVFFSTLSLKAQVSQRGTTTTATTTSTTLTITTPTGVVTGDIMLISIAQEGNNSTSPSCSGWTLIKGTSLAGGTSRYGAVLYRIATGSEGGNSLSFTLGSGTNYAAGGIVAFSGVNTSTPFDVTPVAISVQGNQTGVSATSITTVSAKAAIIMFGMAAGSNPTWSGWQTATSPGSLTELFDNTVGNTSDGASVGAAWATQTSAGSTGAGSASLSSSERNGGILIALKPIFLKQFRSIQNGNWSDNSTWQQSTDGGSTWSAATTVPTSSDGLTTIQSGHTVSLTANATVSTLTVNGILNVASYSLTGVNTLSASSGSTIYVGGSNNFPSGFTTISLDPASTVNYNMSGTQTVAGVTYGNLTLSGTNAKTLQIGTTNITGNLTLSGTASTTTVVGLTIGGNLIIGDGTTFTVGAYNLTVSGTTTVGGGTSGNLIINGYNGTKIFTGIVTINTGGSWDNSSASSPVTFRGGITNNGTFTAGNAYTYTFDTNNQALTGNINMSGAAITVTGITLTNNGTLTTTTSNFAGTGTFVNASTGTLNTSAGITIATLTNQGTLNTSSNNLTPTTLTNSGTLNISGSAYTAPTTLTNSGTITYSSNANIGASSAANFTNTGTINFNGTGYSSGITNSTGGILNISTLSYNINTLTATAVGNTVNYCGAGAQTILNTAYYNLTLSGSGTKIFSAATTIGNNLSIGSGVVANLGTYTHTALALYFVNVQQATGSWGSSSSSATNKNDTYFAATTGIVNISPGWAFWYKADAGVTGTTTVTKWADQSSNANNATNSGSVSLTNNSINFNPSLTFSNVNRQMITASATKVQSFVIVNFPNYSSIQHLGGLIGATTDNGIRAGSITSPYDWAGDANVNDWVYGSNGTSWVNGTSGTSAFTNWHIVTQSSYQQLNSQFYLGGYYSVSARPFYGNIAEIMAFSGAVANQNNVESYLAIKYGITLSHDYSNGSGTTVYSIASYANDIAGLGADATYGLNQKVSSSVNLASGSTRVVMATINDFTSSNQTGTRTALTNGQYLVWGHNGVAVGSFSTPTTGYYPIIGRIWKAQNTNAVGAVNFQIDLTSFPSSETGMYVLLVSSDASFSTSNTTEYLLTNSSGNLYYNSSVTFPAGTSYFTIGKPAYSNAVYVRQGGWGTKTGDSWTNAMAYVQQAVEASNSLTTKLPVYVAAGSYSQYYTTGDYAAYTNSTGQYWQGWSNAFVVRSGVNVYGAFPENGNTNNNNAGMSDRVVLSTNSLYQTTLNGGTNIRVVGPVYAVTPLASGSGLATSTTWDGFTLTNSAMNSNAAGGDDRCGAGAYTVANFTLSNCMITGNTTSSSTTNDGAGAEMDGGTLYKCMIYNNTTGYPTSTSCNCAGTINIRSGGCNIINCLIVNNFAYYGGGAISINGPTTNCYLINNTIADNTSTSNSSGIHIFGSSSYIYLYNNAIWNNVVYGVTNANAFNNAWPNGYSGSTGTNSLTFGSTNTYFVNSSSDFRLISGSALIDKGSSSVTNYSLVNGVDIRGVFRDATPDIGCYEKGSRLYFVNNASTDLNACGLNWTSPYKTVQAALDQYDSNDYPQVYVAQGSSNYTPSKNASGNSSTGSDALFLLKDNISVYGGFSGTPGTEPAVYSDITTRINSRNMKTYSTILSGNNTSNSLFSYNSTANNAILDGFTLTGTAGGTSYYTAIIPSTATIQNCLIKSNATNGLSLLGGAFAYNILSANNAGDGVKMTGTATLINATVVNNKVYGVHSDGTSSPTVKNTILWNNNNTGIWNSYTSGGNLSDTTLTITNSASTSNYKTFSTYLWKIAKSNNNIDLGHRSPNFKQPGKGNYELLLISPCLGIGSTAANSLSMDAYGQSRKFGTTIDLGAFQKWDGLTISGSSPTTATNTRKGYSITIANMTTDTAEVLIKQGTTNLNASFQAKWLEIKDSTLVTSTLYCPTITGTVTADSVLYVRSFPLYKNGSTTSHAWSFFGLPYPVSSFNNIDGAILESSVRIQKYSESIRAQNGVSASGGNWTTQSTSSQLNVGTGYSLNMNSIKLPYLQTIIFPSSGSTIIPNTTGDVTGLTYTTSGSLSWTERGWNLISNPYPQVAYINPPASDPSSIYWPDGSTTDNSLYPGGVYVYSSNTDSYTIWTRSDFNSNGLSPYGACFIKTGNTSNTTVHFTTETTSTPLRTKSLETETSSTVTPVQFRFDIAGGNASNHTYVIFHPSASADLVEQEDYPNWSSASTGSDIVMNTFATGSTVGLGINTLPFSGTSMEVPLQVSVPAAGSYTITLPNKSDTLTVYIKDSEGSLTNLNLSSYTFTVADASTTPNFTLVFNKSNGSPAANATDGITLIQNKSSITLYDLDVMQQILVYSPTGQLCSQKEVTGYEASFDLPTMPGVYLVKVITNKGSVTKKIINP